MSNTISTTSDNHRTGNPNWPGRGGNPNGRPLSAKGIRGRLMRELSEEILAGDKGALDAYLKLEKSGAPE